MMYSTVGARTLTCRGNVLCGICIKVKIIEKKESGKNKRGVGT